MTPKPLVIIPARGGSKGIPRKNIAPLCGRPLIAYTIDAAKAVCPIENIVLSTDSEEIAETARKEGLKVDYMRPAVLGGDKVGSREVILDAMDYADRRAIEYDRVILLQPTSPLRQAEDILNADRLFRENEADIVVTVCESSANPYYDCFEPDANGYLKISKGDGTLTRRQDAPKVYQYNGAVYVINPQSIREKPMGSFERVVPSPMAAERSVDIDSPLDLAIAEIIMKNQNQ